MTRITHNSVFAATSTQMPDFDFKIDIRHFPFLTSSIRRAQSPLNSRPGACVKLYRGIMRGFIIRDVSIEEIVAARCLQAVEGYLELGMFEEAEKELRELDPAWFASQQVLSLQLRVLAGLNEV